MRYNSRPVTDKPEIDNFIYFQELTNYDRVEVIRLRFLTDRTAPILDFSYGYFKVYKNGESKKVKIKNFPGYQLDKRKWKTQLVNRFKKYDIFANNLFGGVSIDSL